MDNLKGIELLSRSDFIVNGGVGMEDPLVFVNAAACMRTHFAPSVLWFQLTAIESKLGRIRTKVNGPRTIDIDLLWWSCGKFRDEWITLPHPRFYAPELAEQAFERAGFDRELLKK